MVEVGGKPILEYTLEILPPEIDEVVLVVGYLHEKIREKFQSSFNGRRIRYAYQPEPKGTSDALYRAREFLNKESFMLLYADDLYHPYDLRGCVSDSPVVLVKETEHPEKFGVCLVNEEGLLLDILEKTENPPGNLVNIGVYTLNEGIFSVPQFFLLNGEANLAAQIGAWAKTERIRTVKARFWHPIGYPEDLLGAEEYISLPLSERIN
jgi:NDP-sugar pyrophosphorylase family protein